MSFVSRITQYNIGSVILRSQPEAMSSESYKRIAGYFSDKFMFASGALRGVSGDSEMTKILSLASDILDEVDCLDSLEEKSNDNAQLFNVLCSIDEKFKDFVNKFLPEFEITDSIISEIVGEKVAPGKITKFPTVAGVVNSPPPTKER